MSGWGRRLLVLADLVSRTIVSPLSSCRWAR
jgi:hypothetical protein